MTPAAVFCTLREPLQLSLSSNTCRHNAIDSSHSRPHAHTHGPGGGGYLGYSKQKVATYEEFENIVLGAHLQPMEDDILDLDMKKTQKSSTGR